MKILMLVNWKLRYCSAIPDDLQPPDYCVEGIPYWFFRHFSETPDVTVLDVSSTPRIEKFEHYTLRFYVVQAMRAVAELRRQRYDVIISHGAQSAVVLSLLRRIFPTKAKHIVFDIGSFASASESGLALRLLQCASKSLDGLICHASGQLSYYESFFPWLSEMARFIPFGADVDFFNRDFHSDRQSRSSGYLCCVGAGWRDWDTLVRAYRCSRLFQDRQLELVLVGCPDRSYEKTDGVHCTDKVTVCRMKEIVGGALFCVHPLLEYRFSYGQMTLLQMMALGKLVIASYVTGIRDYFQPEVTAIGVASEDVQGLSEALIRAACDADLRRRIGEKAREATATRFSECAMARSVERYILQVLTRSSR